MSTLPEVEVTIRNNSLGLQDPAAGDALAVVGPATAGPTVPVEGVPTAGAVNVPLLYGRTAGLEEDYESGALIEAAAAGLEVTGRPVVVVRTETSTAGAMGALNIDGVTGTAVPVATSGATPIDDYEAEIRIVGGGTIETDGITYLSSLDGGRTLSPLTALGTGTVIAPEGGVSFTVDPPAGQVTALITFAIEARSDALAHFGNETAHDAADTAAAAAVTLGAPSTAAEAWAVLNQLRTAWALHLANTSVHNSADTTNTITHAAATNSSSGVGLAREWATDYAAHLANATVHNSADVTNTISAATPAHGTLVAGDKWTCRTSMPASSDAELDAALAALQVSAFTWKTGLILSPVTSTATAAALKTRWLAMVAAHRYKKLFCSFRRRNIGESKAAYLAAYKAAFDAVECHGLVISADVEEHQSSATKRVYARPPSWLGAAWHVKRGPDISLASVDKGAGALPLGATIKDVNGNPKYHDEELDPGLDAARALTLRSHYGYKGAFFTRARTLAQPGTDFMFLHFWAVMIEVLDVAVPLLIGQIQAKVAPDPGTGRVLEAAARAIELGVEHDVGVKVKDKNYIVSCRCVLDRTVNIWTSPKLPVEISAVPFGYNDGFKLTVMLVNPQFSNG